MLALTWSPCGHKTAEARIIGGSSDSRHIRLEDPDEEEANEEEERSLGDDPRTSGRPTESDPLPSLSESDASSKFTSEPENLRLS